MLNIFIHSSFNPVFLSVLKLVRNEKARFTVIVSRNKSTYFFKRIGKQINVFYFCVVLIGGLVKLYAPVACFLFFWNIPGIFHGIFQILKFPIFRLFCYFFGNIPYCKKSIFRLFCYFFVIV